MNRQRRAFVIGIGCGLLAAQDAVHSQGRAARIGWVGGWYSPSAATALLDAFRAGMRELGYVEGANLVIDARWMTGSATEEAAGLTAQLVRSKVDVLVAQGLAVVGVKAQAANLPVVFGFSGDPVAAKLVSSLARPGGNLTGFSLLAPALAGKRVELLKEAAPRISRLAVLTNPLHPGEDQELQETRAAATRLGLAVASFPVQTVADVKGALERMADERIDALIALSNLLIMAQRGAIAEFAVRHRVPTMSAWQDFVIDGNLMSYGPDLERAWRDVGARYVDKVLRGDRPGDLSVQQPTEFQLVLNQRTAKALGIELPLSLALRAERVLR